MYYAIVRRQTRASQQHCLWLPNIQIHHCILSCHLQHPKESTCKEYDMSPLHLGPRAPNLKESTWDVRG